MCKMETLPAIVLKDGQRLRAISREKDARHYGYVVSDRFGTVVMCTQKLPLAAAYIERLAGDDAYSRVAVASLYEAASKGRLAHRRWKCTRTALDRVSDEFEQQRKPGVKSVVLCHPHRIQIG